MRLSPLFAVTVALFPGRLAAQTSATLILRHAVRDTTLSNGLSVIAVENHAVPLVTVEVAVKTGAFTQEPGDEGVPHLFEHMLFKSYVGDAGRTFPQDAGSIDAAYNGTTAEEAVTYWLMVPSSNLDAAMAMLAQLVRDPEFTADNLNRERFVVFDEIHRDESDPIFLLHDQVAKMLWTTSWGRKDALGRSMTLWQVTPKRLTEIFHRYYVPNNTAVIVGGDATVAQVFASANHHFGHWTRRDGPIAATSIPPIAPLARSTALVIEGDVNDVVLLMMWQGPSVTDNRDDTYAADVLSTILDAPGSTFQQRLVDSGLFSSCTLGYQTLAHVGPITLVAHTSVDSLPRALDALWLALTELGASNAFTDEELEDAHQSRTVQEAFELDDAMAFAHGLGYFWTTAGLDYLFGYTEQMRAVRHEAIQRYVARYISNSPTAIGVLVPNGRGKSLQPIIARFLSAEQVGTQ